MENGGLVSVIIPVFNVRPYLAEALDSVLRQTYEHLEILLIDDGSADGSGEMCDEYARRDGRIRVIHQANRGLSGARNAGLNAMTGDAVVFLDPDDALRPDYVQKMAEAMVREGAELVLCKYEEHRTDGRMERTGRERAKPLIGEGLYDREEALRALVDERLNKSVWNKLYSRRLWENIRYPDGHVYEDIATTFRILDLCRTVYVLDEPLYLHRIRPGSITGSHLPEKSRDWLLAWSQFDAFIETHTPEIFTPKQLKKKPTGSARPHDQFLRLLCLRKGRRRQSLQRRTAEENHGYRKSNRTRKLRMQDPDGLPMHHFLPRIGENLLSGLCSLPANQLAAHAGMEKEKMRRRGRNGKRSFPAVFR